MMGPGFNLPAAISRNLGCIPVVSSVDGSGFAHTPRPTPDSRFEVDERVNAVCAAAPNLIVTIGSLNSDKVIENGDANGSKITAAVKSFVDKVRAKLPQVPIVMVSAEPSSVARLISRPSHINVKAHKAGVEAAGGVANGVAFVDWIGLSERQAVVWLDQRQCAEGDVVVYNGVAYRITQAWTPAAGETPLTAGAPAIQVSDVLSGTGNEGNKKADGTRDTLLMSDDTHPTKIGSLAFGAAATKRITDALSDLSAWISAKGAVYPAPSATPQPPTPQPSGDGLPVMAWLPGGWGQSDRNAYTLDEIKAVAALKPDRIALPIVRTNETISTTSPDAGVAISTKYTGSDGKTYNFSDGSFGGIAGRGVNVASMVQSLDYLEGVGITVMPNMRNGLEDYAAQWSKNSTEKIAAQLMGREGKSYDFVMGHAETLLKEKLRASHPTIRFTSNNFEAVADWQISDSVGCVAGVLGPSAGAPAYGAAKAAFPEGVWVGASNEDEKGTARALAKAAGVTILGWVAATPEALAELKKG
uniref:Sialate O-acetylesterase domain-containing protein n=1 Tax=Dulem virus 38 TaxID=3145756 RepID=A0AAU8B398_9CAUD